MRRPHRPLVATSLAIGLILATAPAQSTTGDPTNAARLESLEDVMRDREMQKDAEGVQLLGEIGASYAELNKADGKRTVKAVGVVFMVGRLREPDQADLYKAAAAALAKMESAGARQLVKVFESKRIPNKEPWAFMRAELVRRIGETKDPKMIKFLCERIARTPYDEVLLAAGETLANYAEVDQKLRDPIVKGMIGKLGALESAASMTVLRADTPQQLGTLNAKATLDKITAPWNSTLSQLTHEKFANGHEWQHWYNKNKNKKWVPVSER